MAELGRTLPFPPSLAAQTKPPASSCLFFESPPHPHLSTLGRHTEMQANFTGLSSDFTFSKKAFLKHCSRKNRQFSVGSQVCSLGFICWAVGPLKAGSTYSHCYITPATYMPTCSTFLNEEECEKCTAGSTRMCTCGCLVLISGARAGVKGCAWATVCAGFLARTRCQPCNFCLR